MGHYRFRKSCPGAQKKFFGIDIVFRRQHNNVLEFNFSFDNFFSFLNDFVDRNKLPYTNAYITLHTPQRLHLR
jgi:hypothetical protein